MTSQVSDVRGDEPSSRTRQSDRSTSETDDGRWRRVGSALLGGALVVFGLGRRSLRGAIAAVAGGWLLYRGVSGPRGGAGTSRSGGAAAREQQRETGAPPSAVDAERSITIEAPADELFDRWQDPATHERIWADFADVESAGEDRQHWAVGGPMGATLEWDADVVEKHPGELLRWESLPGATVSNEGIVRFRSRSDREETEVTLHVRFDPPGGRLGTEAMRRLDVVPDAVTGKALRRFKSLVETGEIPTLERNPSARGSGDLV